MHNSKFAPRPAPEPADRLVRLGAVLGVAVILSACGAVPVDIVGTNHPANAVAVATPLAETTGVLDEQAIERSEAPVMDHSMHGM